MRGTPPISNRVISGLIDLFHNSQDELDKNVADKRVGEIGRLKLENAMEKCQTIKAGTVQKTGRSSPKHVRAYGVRV